MSLKVCEFDDLVFVPQGCLDANMNECGNAALSVSWPRVRSEKESFGGDSVRVSPEERRSGS